MTGLFNYQIPKKIKGKYTDAQKWNYYKSKTEPKLYDQLYTASIPEDESSLLRTVREIKELFQEFKTKNKTITHKSSDVDYDASEIHSIHEMGLPTEVKYQRMFEDVETESEIQKLLGDEPEEIGYSEGLDILHPRTEMINRVLESSRKTKDPLEGKVGRPHKQETLNKYANIIQNSFRAHKARHQMFYKDTVLPPDEYLSYKQVFSKRVKGTTNDKLQTPIVIPFSDGVQKVLKKKYETDANGNYHLIGANNFIKRYQLDDKQPSKRKHKRRGSI